MKMKKTMAALLVAAALFVVSISSAQPIRLGVKAGLQTSSLGNFKSLSVNNITNMSASNTFGYQVGAMARFSLLGLYVQPELVYSSSRFNMNIPNHKTAKVTLNNFEVPILVGAKFFFAHVFAGPVFNLSNETSTKGGDLNVFATRFDKSSVGFQIGAGVTLGKIDLDLRYGGQFKRPIQNITINNATQSIKTSLNAWQFNLGYFF